MPPLWVGCQVVLVEIVDVPGGITGGDRRRTALHVVENGQRRREERAVFGTMRIEQLQGFLVGEFPAAGKVGAQLERPGAKVIVEGPAEGAQQPAGVRAAAGRLVRRGLGRSVDLVIGPPGAKLILAHGVNRRHRAGVWTGLCAGGPRARHQQPERRPRGARRGAPPGAGGLDPGGKEAQGSVHGEGARRTWVVQGRPRRPTITGTPRRKRGQRCEPMPPGRGFRRGARRDPPPAQNGITSPVRVAPAPARSLPLRFCDPARFRG